MIGRLFTALGPEHDRALRRLLGLLTAAAVLQGVAFVLLVPVLGELLGGTPERAWPWVIALAVLWIGFAAVNYAGTLAGFGTGANLSRDLHHRIGDTVARLPLAWFTADRVGGLGRLAGQRVLDVMGVPAHLLRQVVDATVTPFTPTRPGGSWSSPVPSRCCGPSAARWRGTPRSMPPSRPSTGRGAGCCGSASPVSSGSVSSRRRRSSCCWRWARTLCSAAHSGPRN
jgi:hypothetical protein